MSKRKTTSHSTSKGGKKAKQSDNTKDKRTADLLAAGFNEYGGALTEILLDKLIAGRHGIKVFFPLCADSVDMKRVYDRGHEVVGIEMGKSMIEKFYKRHKLEYTVTKIKEGNLYQNVDGRLRIYCCDFFKFDPKLEGGQFDAVLDQRAICSLYPEDKLRYVKKIKTVFAPNFTYFFDTNDINRDKFPKSKGNFIIKDVESWFGKEFKIEILQKLDATLTKGKNYVSLVMQLIRK